MLELMLLLVTSTTHELTINALEAPWGRASGKLLDRELMDQSQYLSNYLLSPPLIQQQSTDNKLGLMLG